MMSSAASSQHWNGRKISPPNYGLKNSNAVQNGEEPDPGQLLNEWLGELDNLQKVIYAFKNWLNFETELDSIQKWLGNCPK